MSGAAPKEDPTLAKLAIALGLPPVLRADPAIVRRAVGIAIDLDADVARSWLAIGEALLPRLRLVDQSGDALKRNAEQPPL